MPTYTIAQLAKAHRITMRALRFYEKTELLKPARSGTTRVYSENDRLRLIEILKGTRLGFTLGEIHKMLKDGETGPWLEVSPAQALEQLKIMRGRLADAAGALADLEKMAGIHEPGAVTVAAAPWSLTEPAGVPASRR